MAILPQSNIVIYEGSVTFNNDSAIETVKILSDIPKPVNINRFYLVTIINPSLETNLITRLYIKETINSVVRYGFLETVIVEPSPDEYNPDNINKINGNSVIVEGLMSGQGCFISLYNDTLLGASGGFTASVVIRELA